MVQSQPLMHHARRDDGEPIYAISWGRIRNRGSSEAPSRDPMSGPLADFLNPEVPNPSLEGVVDSSSDDLLAYFSDANPLAQLHDDCRAKLGEFGCSLGSYLDQWVVVWDILSKPVRRALVALSLLSDDGCLLTRREDLKHKASDDLGKFLGENKDDRMRLEFGERLRTGGMGLKQRRELLRLEKNRHARELRHLIRPGGLAATDIAWLARSRSRGERRSLIASLEALRAIRRRISPGGQPRYFPLRPRVNDLALFYRQACVAELRAIGRIAKEVTPSRKQNSANEGWCSIGPRERGTGKGGERYYRGERWANLGGPYYVLGVSPPPHVAHSLRASLDEMTKSFPFVMYWGKEKDVDVPVYVVIRIQRGFNAQASARDFSGLRRVREAQARGTVP